MLWDCLHNKKISPLATFYAAYLIRPGVRATLTLDGPVLLFLKDRDFSTYGQMNWPAAALCTHQQKYFFALPWGSKSNRKESCWQTPGCVGTNWKLYTKWNAKSKPICQIHEIKIAEIQGFVHSVIFYFCMISYFEVWREFEMFQLD